MKTCPNCGTPYNRGDRFCNNCGAPIMDSKNEMAAAPNPPMASGMPASGNDSGATDFIAAREIKKQEKAEKRKKLKKIFRRILIILISLGIIAGAVAFAAHMMFPLSVTVDAGNQQLNDVEGIFDNLEFQIKSNQPIRYVSYAINPEDPEGKDGYQQVDTGKDLFGRTLKIDHLETPFGENRLYIRVATLFGKADNVIVLVHDIGYSSAPEEDALVSIAPDAELVSNELLVVFKEDATADEINQLVEDYDAEIVGENYLLGEYQLRFSGDGEDYINNIMDKLNKEDIVESVFFNMAYITEQEFTPDDSKYDSWDVGKPGGNNWGLEAINAPGAWDHIDELETVRIGVIDSSLQYDHSDLQIDPNRIHVLPTNDFKTIDDIEDYYDEYVSKHRCRGKRRDCVFCSMKDHGTHCTGIIGALGNNGAGVAGVAWNAEMYFTTAWYLEKDGTAQMKNYDTTGGFMYDITWLAANGCRVMSMSIGSSSPTDPDNIDEFEISDTEHYDRTFKKLQDAGYDFLFCKSAGNNNDDARNYRLNRVFMNAENAKNHVIIVASAQNTSTLADRLAAWLSDTDKIYNLAGYSNYGEMVDIAAPGSNIYSTVFGDTYESMNGTSMATPMVAGVAGLVFGANPNLSSDSVKRILCFTGNNFCEKKLEVYNMLDAKEAVEWALNNGQQLPERETPTLGFVTGMIQDAETLDLVEDAIVTITDEESGNTFGANIYEGVYEVCLPPGTYTMEFAADGYLTETVYHVEVTAELVSYNVLLNLVASSSVQGTVSGRVINAFDGASIPDASIKIFRGVNNTSGTPVIETTADSYGSYTASLDPGNYTVSCSASGYLDGTANIISIGGKDNTDQDCTLTPILNEGEIRVVLTWGRYPYDLDSHLLGPAPDGSFHTFYQNMNYYYGDTLYDNLDVDDTSSYGPETTSVYVGQSGTYTFYVHNYTDKESTTSSTMSTSGAQVKLYIAGRNEPMVFNVPNQAGTVWKVFTINGTTVTPINTMSYESDPANVGS